MTRWKCGRCQKIYDFDEYIKLEKVQLIPGEPDPEHNHGFTSKCSCGYIFGSEERFHQVEKIVLGDSFIAGNNVEITVSTVFLEMEHDEDMWFETMLFSSEHIVQADYQRRYRNKDDAKKGHDAVVKKLTDGDYKLNISQYDLELE